MRLIIAAAAAIALLAAAPASAGDRDNALIDGPTWADLKPLVIGAAEVADGAALFDLDAPYRAHDAATVPIRIVQAEGTERIVRLTLIVDENPAPVVAEFDFGPAMGRLEFETRVRVDSYSNVRAIAETEDGRLYMTGRFVKASGGCSAPSMKDAEAALAALGQMRMRSFAPEAQISTPRREAQVMIRHPNFSGLQRNQVTQLMIPPHFIDEMEVRAGDETLFSLTGGISISEDPTFRFSYDGQGETEIVIRASDTEGETFEGVFPAGPSQS